jgi:bacillithiol system protein YtxJ
MHPKLTTLQRLDELDRFLAESANRPVVLFKHSYSCGISAEALDELVAHLDARDPDARYAIVTVQTHRDISNAVTSRLGVRHETPQAIVVRGGKVVWTASHFRVNAASLDKALQS